MTEVGRQLRYAVPGLAFELVLGLWLVAGAWARDGGAGNDLLDKIAQSDPSIAVLLIAAAFPLGFIISVIANELAWLRVRLCPEARVLGRIDTGRVIAIIERGPHRRWYRATLASMELEREPPRERREASEAIVELLQRMANRGQAYLAAVERVRSLADLMNGLLNLWAAVALAALVSTVLTFGLGQSASDAPLAIILIEGILITGTLLVVGISMLVGGCWGSCVRERLPGVRAIAIVAGVGASVVLVLLLRDVVADSSLLFVYASFTAIALLLLVLIARAERRVARVTEVFVVGMLGAAWPTESDQ